MRQLRFLTLDAYKALYHNGGLGPPHSIKILPTTYGWKSDDPTKADVLYVSTNAPLESKQ